jgi:hypothetical protein
MIFLLNMLLSHTSILRTLITNLLFTLKIASAAEIKDDMKTFSHSENMLIINLQ